MAKVNPLIQIQMLWRTIEDLQEIARLHQASLKDLVERIETLEAKCSES